MNNVHMCTFVQVRREVIRVRCEMNESNENEKKKKM